MVVSFLTRTLGLDWGFLNVDLRQVFPEKRIRCRDRHQHLLQKAAAANPVCGARLAARVAISLHAL